MLALGFIQVLNTSTKFQKEPWYSGYYTGLSRRKRGFDSRRLCQFRFNLAVEPFRQRLNLQRDNYLKSMQLWFLGTLAV